MKLYSLDQVRLLEQRFVVPMRINTLNAKGKSSCLGEVG